MALRSVCRHCEQCFTHERAGAMYCSSRCRTAACRKRSEPPPGTWWLAHAPRLSKASRGASLSRDELGERLIEIAHTADGGEPKTGRRYYYLALSHGYVRPDMSDTAEAKKSRDAAYDRVTDVLGILRKQGRLDWSMVLDLTREIDRWQTYTSPREARATMRRRYSEDRWLGQAFYPVLIAEKDTLEPVLEPVAREWQMPFVSSRGYSSLKLQHDVAEMFRHRHAATGQGAVVFFVSDLDPSGLDLQRAWEEALDAFGVDCEVARIGLTREQVADHDLEGLGIEVKPSDSRAKSYVKLYGRRCWEADVLPASVLRDAITAEIEARLDTTAWDQRDDEIERARKLL